MSKKLIALATAVAMSGFMASAAQANGSYGHPSYSNGGTATVKQNGNGCRNRCYGTQNFNAGVNNGNYYGKGKGYGHASNGGTATVKQNGNGCRNRCYGTQNFNAGVNNGNYYGKKGH